MVDTVRRQSAIPAVQSADHAAPVKQHHDRDSKFAKALYAALRPPSIDNADASGDFENEEATKAPMKATVLPSPARTAEALGLSAPPSTKAATATRS